MLAKDWLKEILKNLKGKKSKKELLKSKELVLTYFFTEGI